MIVKVALEGGEGRLLSEYSVLQRLDLPGVARALDFVHGPRGPVLVLEDAGPVTLSSRLAEGRPPLEEAWTLAIQLAEVVARVHQRDVAHLDLCPSNVIVDADLGWLTLVDFGRASHAPGLARPGGLRGRRADELRYIAPEQTGRMNRSPDRRADLYALGAVFYELFTGQPPFAAQDDLSIVHAHLALEPETLTRFAPELPEVLSRITLKLLRKSPDERYQSAEALQADLLRARRQGQFELGRHDSPGIRVQGRLYGREAEVGELMAALAASRTRARVVLVTGPEGIGKTALLRRLEQPVLQRSGLFLYGQSDPLEEDPPYGPLTQALGAFLASLEHAPDEERRIWQQRLSRALGPQAAAIGPVVPGLAALLQPATALSELPPEAAAHRFHLALGQLVKTLCRNDQPLVLALDDLHATGPETLAILASLLRDSELRNLLVLVAAETAPPGLAVDLHLSLEPLDGPALMQLAVEALEVDDNSARAVADMLRGFSGGSPLHTRHLLRYLDQERLLRYDRASGAWTWDLARLASLGTELDALLDGLFDGLPQATREVLQLAAAAGETGTLQLLVDLVGSTEQDIHAALLPAIEEGLFEPWRVDAGWRFGHPRIRRRIVARSPQRGELRVRVGELLRSSGRVFDAAARLVDEAAVPAALRAALAEEAGRLARHLAAPQAGLSWMLRAQALAPEPGRARQALELAWLSGDDSAELLLAEQRSEDVDLLAVSCHLARGRYGEALRWGARALERLGHPLPPRVDPALVLRELRALVDRLDGRPAESLADLPRRATGVVDQLLSDVARASFHLRPELFSWVQLRIAARSLELGQGPSSAQAWTWLGVLMASELGELGLGHDFGRLGLELAYEASPGERGRVLFTYGWHLAHWRSPIRDSIGLLDEATRACVDAGELQLATYAHAAAALTCFAMGAPLDEVLSRTKRALSFTRAALPAQERTEPAVDVLLVLRQVVLALQGRTRGPAELDDTRFRLAEFYSRASLNRTSSSLVEALRLQLYVHGEQMEQALARARLVDRTVLPATVLGAEVQLYTALAHAALGEVERVEAELDIMRQRAHAAPGNFRHALSLVEAEQARLRGRHIEAVELYDAAIDAAADGGFTAHVALAQRLAARFHADRGWERFAEVYQEAGGVAERQWGRSTPSPLAPQQQAGDELDLVSVLQAAQAISSEVALDSLLDRLMEVCLQAAGANRGALLLESEGEPPRARIVARLDQAGFHSELLDVPLSEAPAPRSAVESVRQSWSPLVLDDIREDPVQSEDPHLAEVGVKSLAVLPVQRQGTLVGLIVLENTLLTQAFTATRLGVIELLSAQIAISLDQARLFEQLTDEIRERTLAEKARRRSELLFHSLFEHAPDVVVLWDAKTGAIARCNETTGRMLGEAEVVGRPLAALFHPDSYGGLERLLREFYRTDRAEGARLVALTASGERVPVLVNASAVREGGRLLYGQAVLRDITQLEAARSALEEANAQLEERVARRTEQLRDSNTALEASNAELRQFAYLASHDLKSPIRSVASNLQLLERRYAEVLDERGLRYVGKSIHAAVRMQALIDDILAFSQVGQDRRPAVPVSADNALAMALDNLGSDLLETGATLHVEPLSGVLANETRLVQLFQNLVGNAIKYRDPERSPEVKIHSWRKDGMIHFAVQDNGIGFDPDNSRRIFTIFKRLHGKGAYSGNGIGLAICKKIVDMHGGSIEAHSKPGVGSTFTFCLPEAPQR